MPVTYDRIATYTVTGSAATSYTFSSISQTYTDLFLVCNITAVATGQGFRFQYGTSGTIDTGNNYSYTWLTGTGSVASSGRVSSTNQGQFGWAAVGSSTGFTTLTCNIQNYSNTTTFKTAINRSSDAGSETSALVNLWRSTAAITDIRLFPSNSNTMGVGSMLTLYGIKAA
jgi:hypothetical protein